MNIRKDVRNRRYTCLFLSALLDLRRLAFVVVVDAVSELFALLGSFVAEETDAVLAMVAGASAFTVAVICRATDAPLDSEATVQVTVRDAAA